MCKVFALTNMSKIKRVQHTIETIAEFLKARDRDGFGYAIQGKKGLYGERSLKEVFESQLRRVFIDYSFVDLEYNRFGTRGKVEGAGIFHSRVSTNDVNIVNTHPIMKNDWTLIHNGVVSNLGPNYERDTTNDTEHLVHYLSTEGIAGVEKHLSGYYAFAAFDPDGRLHIARDSKATLYCAWSDTIESTIFATTEELIEDIAHELDWKLSNVNPVKDNTYLIFDKGGCDYAESTISPRGSTYAENKHAMASLGSAASAGGYPQDDEANMYGGFDTAYDQATYNDYKRRNAANSNIGALTGTDTKDDKKERPSDGGMLIDGIDTDEIEVIDELDDSDTSKHLLSLADFIAKLEGVSADDYADSIHIFIDTLNNLDSSFTVFDSSSRSVPLTEYEEMNMEAKLDHTLVGPQGMTVCPLDSIGYLYSQFYNV